MDDKRKRELRLLQEKAEKASKVALEEKKAFRVSKRDPKFHAVTGERIGETFSRLDRHTEIGRRGKYIVARINLDIPYYTLLEMTEVGPVRSTEEKSIEISDFMVAALNYDNAKHVGIHRQYKIIACGFKSPEEAGAMITSLIGKEEATDD